MNSMNRPKKYKNDIDLEYRFDDLAENQEILDMVYDELFSQLIADLKKLKRFFASDEFKRTQSKLKKDKSVLYDFISFH